MRLASIRAGLWFFGSILAFLLLFGTSSFEGKSVLVIVLTLGGVGLLFGGLAFFMTWYDAAKEERRLELLNKRRHMALGSEEEE